MPHSEIDALKIVRDALDTEPGGRDDYLSMRCGANTGLRERVDMLLRRIAEDDSLGESAEQECATPASDTRSVDALIGELLGPFRIVDRIGRGGMGIVYRGVREGADFAQEVAIKLIRRGYDFDDVHARFLRERRILARLSHPNLARFIDGGVTDEGRPWFALEFVDGQPITTWCDRHQLDIRARVKLFMEVCAAVQYAHTQLIVHRDLKPGNILVDEAGNVRLLDFGVAQLLVGDDDKSATTLVTATSALTPEYASPEQFTGDPVGVASDIYSLGVLAYVLIAGVTPYIVDRSDMDAARRVVSNTLPRRLSHVIAESASSNDGSYWQPPIDEEAIGNRNENAGTRTTKERMDTRATTLTAYRRLVSGDLSNILDTALAKEPERRYATVAALADDLRRWLAGLPILVSGNRAGYRLRKFVARNRVAVALAGLAALAMLGGIVGMAWQIHETRLQRDAAETEAERSRGVRDYIMLMFGEAGERGDAENVSVREVFKRNSDHVFDRYKNQPKAGWNIALMLGEFFLHLGDDKGARTVLEQLLRWPGLETEPDLLASARYSLAQVESNSGNTAQARGLLDQAQSFWVSDRRRYALNLNISRSLQAEVELAEGHLETAVATLEQAITERRKLLSKPDRELATSLNDLASILLSAARDKAAYERADESVALYATLDLARSSAGLAAINNRAVAAYRLGRFDVAIAGMREAVDLRRQLFGSTTELAEAMNNLGVMLTRQDRAAEAIPILKEALQIAVDTAGEDGQTAFAPRRNLSDAYVAVGRISDAEPLAERSVLIGRDRLGADSIFAGAGYATLARLRAAQGRNGEARAALDRAAAIFTKLGDTGSPHLKTLAELRAKLDRD
ncbi:MAG: serine/threonine-protein kinase [Dokdonella sp.]